MTILDEAAPLPVEQSLSTIHSTLTAAHIRQDARRRGYVTSVDAIAAVVVAAAAAFLMDNLPLQMALILPLVWLLGSWLAGSYLNRTLKAKLVDVRRLAMTTVTIWAGAGVLAQVHSIPGARAMVLVLVPATALAVMAGRIALLPFARRWHRLACAPVVAVGSSDSVAEFIRSSNTASSRAPRVAAACLTDTEEVSGLPRTLTYSMENLTHAVRTTGADTVVVLDDTPANKLREFSWELERLGVGVAVKPLWSVAPHRVNVRPLGDTTLVEVSPPRYSGGRRVVRDAADRVVAGMGLLLVLPLFAIIATAIKLTSRGPVFYRQERTGLGGNRFKLWKFRTMIPNAHAQQSALAAQNNYSKGTLFKIPNDPRVTKVGRWLRKTSLDELPQLLNVLTGDMAMVGPRPTSTPPEKMATDYRRRMLVKPGLTGLWQVSGRSNLPWEEAVRLDLHYVENRSVDMDLEILRRTLPAVLAKDGAY